MSDLTDSDADRLRKDWFGYFKSWQYLHWLASVYISGVSAIVASAVLQNEQLKNWLALSVAVMSAIYATINPRQRADAYRSAWVVLNLDHLRRIGTAPETVRAVEAGEAIIGRRAVAVHERSNRDIGEI